MFSNPTALRLYGLRQSEVTGTIQALDAQFELHDLTGRAVPMEDYPAIRLLRGERFTETELWIRRRGSNRRWLGLYNAVLIENSTTLGVLSVRDVTARHDPEARHRATFEVNPTAMSVMRLEDLQFTEVNASFLELTGYARDEVIGKTAHELRLYALTKKREAAIQKLRRGETDRVIELELELRTQTGEPRTVLSQGRLIAFNGEPYLIDTYVDITERKRSETELSRAIQAAMSDPTWFVQVVQDKLFEIRSGTPTKRGLEGLSNRERQVLEQIASGRNNDAIAAELGIAVQTVRNYISTVYDKIGVNSRAEAVVWARERGIIFPT